MHRYHPLPVFTMLAETPDAKFTVPADKLYSAEPEPPALFTNCILDNSDALAKIEKVTVVPLTEPAALDINMWVLVVALAINLSAFVVPSGEVVVFVVTDTLDFAHAAFEKSSLQVAKFVLCGSNNNAGQLPYI